MILNQELAQKLVDNIMNNLGYNINIMNEEGVIIASGSKERIGTYHMIAKEVINKRERIDIDKGEENHYEGVKEGINMPFYYKHSIAGVIGITGDPKEIENAAEIVRMSTELMLEQQALKERVYSYQSQKTFFINTLLSINSDEQALSTTQWGLKLGYDLHIPRVVCMLSLNNLKSLVSENPLLTKEIVKQDILKIIKGSKYHTKQDISSFINVDELIIFKTVKKQTSNSIKLDIKDYIDNLFQNLSEKYAIKMHIGVGTYHSSLYGLKKSYNEAKAMVLYGNLMDKINEMIYAGDQVFEFLMSTVNRELLDHFLSPYVDKLKGKPDIIKTIEALVRNDMNLLRASKELYVHRNTLIFRINKIKDMLDINPLHNESDRLLLHLIYLYQKYQLMINH